MAVLICIGASAPDAVAQVASPDSLEGPVEPEALEAHEESTASLEEAAEALDAMHDQRVDVNRAGVDELAAVPGLGPLAARAIHRRRADYGPFAALNQLLDVPHVTEEMLAQARPYLALGSPPRGSQRARGLWRGSRLTIAQTLRRRLDLPAGYRGADSSRAYPGSPVRLNTRIQARLGRHLSWNLTLEKDPGEPLATGLPRFDHSSMSLGLRGAGPVNALVVGDYIAEFGQGLALWRAAGLGKSADATTAPVRAGRGLRAYGSSSEFGFLRGAGVTIAPLPWLSATALVSRRRLDATIVDTGSGGRVATSLSADGLHRTPAEIARRGSLGESLAGVSVEVGTTVRGTDVRLGVVGYGARFDLPIEPAPRPDNRHALRGHSYGITSIYGDVRGARAHAFGELARGLTGPAAFVVGAGGSLGSAMDILVVVRRYPPAFVAPHGAPFGERNGPGQNEDGLYGAIRMRPTRALTIAGYFDAYRFPWLRFNVPRPSRGHEALAWTELRPRRWIRLYAHRRTETADAAASAANVAGGSVVGALDARGRGSIRLQADFDAGRALRLRARVETIRARSAGTTSVGSLLSQDVRWSPRPGIRLDARITMFRTDDFHSRLYQLETDVAGSFTMPALHGTGVRTYLAATASPFGGLTVQGRIGATFLEDTTRQGSGPDAIDGNRTADVSLQVRWRLRRDNEN